MDDIRAEVKRTGKPYEDREFPAVDSSVFYSRKPPRPFAWKRPSEICDDPMMFVDGASQLDIKQGSLGDCWLLAAMAALAQKKFLLDRVVPHDYVANPNDRKYIGALKFSIWQYGAWTDVIIDDRLPTYNNKLVFVHSASINEFWSALLEKAYAKLCGSYESLKGGQTGEALEDFTGGLSESFDLTKAPANLFSIMVKGQERGALMGCSIAAKANEIESKANYGLVKGHAYTVTDAKKVQTRYGEKELVRVRNPWGNEREWTGAWGDKSSEWSSLSESERNKLGLNFKDDGEFWMDFKDFVRNYTTLEICMLGADSAATNQSNISFESRQEQGSWSRDFSAGGCRNFIKSFFLNPQFRIKLEDSDDDADDKCTIIVALMQKDRRKDKSKGMKMLTMGYSIYKVDPKNPTKKLDTEFFTYNSSTARSPSFINSREICGRFELPPGEYVVIPSTFQPNDCGQFVLRMFSEKAHGSEEVDQKTHFVPSSERKPQISTEQNDSLDSKFKDIFDSACGDDEEIDAHELQTLMSAAFETVLKRQTFSLESCRSIVALYDKDLSGKLGFKEFKETVMQIKKWQAIFSAKDENNSGTMDAYELMEATALGGFTLSNRIGQAIVVRFSNKNGQVSFDDFVQIMVRLNVLSNNFECHESRGIAKFTLTEFLTEGMVI